MGMLLGLIGVIWYLINRYHRSNHAGSSGAARGARSSGTTFSGPLTYDQDDSPVSYMEYSHDFYMDDMQHFNHSSDTFSFSTDYIGIDINPATGLPMAGGLDVMGNPYGTDLHSNDSFSTTDWHSHDSFSSMDSFSHDCFSSTDSFSSTDCGFSHFD